MAKCEFCGKDVAFGIKVSHSHRRSNRTWKPNVKKVKAIVNGSPKSLCLHSLPSFRQGHKSCLRHKANFIRTKNYDAFRVTGERFFVFVGI